MEVKDNIFGCFMKIGFDPNLTEQEFNNLDKEFSPYIWGNMGICNKLKKLKYVNYGKDLVLALFQFNVKPTSSELQKLKDIEPYRKNEKAIGLPIIINDINFFRKSEEERYIYLKQSILHKLDLLEKEVLKKKLDTNIELLKTDLMKLLN